MDCIEKQMGALNEKITARISNLGEDIADLKMRQRDDEFIFSVLYCKECHNEILTEGKTGEAGIKIVVF